MPAGQGAATSSQPTPGPGGALGWGRLALVRLPALLLLVGSIWMLRLFFRDARFRVSEVVVEGARLLSREQIEQALGLEQMATFRVSPSRLADQLVDAFPIVAHATVKCELPGKVTIQVQEHTAVLLWESGGRTWWVDSQGNVLGGAPDPLGLVVVHDVEGVAPSPAGHLPGAPLGLAWEIVQALPAVRAFDYAVDEGLVLHVGPAQWPVYMGHSGDAREKVAVMLALAQQLVDSRADVAYIDLRNERRPVYKRQ
jgi:cell division septal protein FtsQ